MSRSRGVVLVIAALMVTVVGGGVILFNRIGPFDGAGASRGGPGGGAQGINAKIVGLDTVTDPERPPDVGTSSRPTRPSPGGTVSAGSAGGGGGAARSGGGAAVSEAAPATCTVSLLQSILGLGVTLLGGRPTC